MQSANNNDGFHYVQQLVSQQLPPPNEFVADIVQQMRAAESELCGILPQLEKAQNEVEQLKAKRIALSSISRQLAVTLVRWRDAEAAKAIEDAKAKEAKKG